MIMAENIEYNYASIPACVFFLLGKMSVSLSF